MRLFALFLLVFGLAAAAPLPSAAHDASRVTGSFFAVPGFATAERWGKQGHKQKRHHAWGKTVTVPPGRALYYRPQPGPLYILPRQSFQPRQYVQPRQYILPPGFAWRPVPRHW